MVSYLKRSNKEEDIISGLKSGMSERRKWEKKLYESFFYLINYGVRKYKIAEEEAASAYSDTIISVIESVVNQKFEGKSSLKSFTFQIFMNKCVDLIRKKTTNKRTVDNNFFQIDSIALALPDSTHNVIQEIIRKNENNILLEKIKELGEKCRQILLMFEEGFSDKEIAIEMAYNSANVAKTSRMRCIEKLREKVTARNI